MNDQLLTRISLFISVIWLLFLFMRIFMVSQIEMDPAQQELFINVLNVLLIGFIAIFGTILGLRAYRYSAAKAKKDTHCQQCYAKMSLDQEFCPKCGWPRDPNYNKEKL